MATINNLTEFLTGVADAIRAKKSTTALINPQDFASEIASISGGGDEPQPEGTHKVTFIDVDGTVLKTEYVADGGSATAPDTPTREKCTFVEWMDDFSNVTEDIMIFPQWVSSDGYTHYQISAAAGEYVRLQVQNASKTQPVTIYWGDGSSDTLPEDLSYHYVEHIYSAAVDGWIDVVGGGEYICVGISYLANTPVVGVVYGNFKNLKACCRQMYNLRYAVIPNTVTTVLSQDPFRNCKILEYLAFPDSITNLNAFGGLACENLKYCRLSKNATSINNFFASCRKLKEITVPEGITSLPGMFAQYCTNLEKITFNPRLTTIGKSVFTECYMLEDFNIPDSVTSIGSYCFQYCFGLKSVHLPSALITLDEGVFSNCLSLGNITIPDTVTSIGAYCFKDCGNAVFDYDFSKLTSVGGGAFYDCIRLTGDLRLTGLVSITNGAFYNTGISSLYTTATRITMTGVDGAFHCCNILKRVELPNIVTVEKLAFESCKALELVILGEQCTTIGDTAFRNCDALTRMVIKSTTPPTLNSSALTGDTALTAIYVPDASVDTYKAATNWSAYADKILPLSQFAE